MTCDHLVGQAHELAVDVGDVGRLRLEDGVAEDADLVRGGGARHSAARLPWRWPYPRPVSAGQYFTEEPAVGSSRRTLMLNLPDLAVPLWPTAACSPATAWIRARTTCCWRCPLRRRPATCSTSAAGTGRSPSRWPAGRRAPRCGRSTSTSGPWPCARRTPPPIGLPNVRCVAPDAVPDHVAFATIWCNPPIRIGKAPLHTLLLRWLGRLEEGAAAHLVVQKHLGADSLRRGWARNGLPTTRRGSRQGYRLLDVTCASSTAPA